MLVGWCVWARSVGPRTQCCDAVVTGGLTPENPCVCMCGSHPEVSGVLSVSLSPIVIVALSSSPDCSLFSSELLPVD